MLLLAGSEAGPKSGSIKPTEWDLMKLVRNSLATETDYFQVRNFLREVFLLNNRRNIAGMLPASTTGAGICIVSLVFISKAGTHSDNFLQ